MIFPANYQRHRIASAIYESVLSAQVAITHQKNPFPPVPNLFGQPFPVAASIYPPKPNPFELKRKSQKAALVVFELIASVVILYSPYYLFVIVYAFYRRKKLNDEEIESSENVMSTLIFLGQFLLLCSPTLNAILYGFKNKTMQESIHNFWRKQKTKIELHYEIQARTPSTCGSRRASMTEITNNLPAHQPQLKRQLSEFFFGTSSSFTSNLNDEATTGTGRMYRTPSDSMFSRSDRRRSSHHEYLSPHFDPLGKMSNSNNNNNNSSGNSSPPTTHSVIKQHQQCLTTSTSKTLLNNFKKLLLVGSKNEINDDDIDGIDDTTNKFPQILITKFSDTRLNSQSQSTSRRDSDNNIQQVEIGVDSTTSSSVDEEKAEKEPLLTTQTHSLEDFYQHTNPTTTTTKATRQIRTVRMKMKAVENVKFQTL